MTAFSEFLNTDGDGVKTSAVYASGAWKLPATVADGDDAAIGAKANAAVTDPTTSASVVSILKGLLTFLRVSAAGLGKAEDAAHVSGDTGVMSLAVRRDTAAASSGTTGDYEPLQTDSTGRLRIRTRLEEVKASNARTTALASSLVVKASPGVLFGFQGYTTAAGFILVHNTTSVPADGQVPVEVIPVEANKPFSLDFGVRGLDCTTGITIVKSTTGPTKTLGAADTWISAQYE